MFNILGNTQCFEINYYIEEGKYPISLMLPLLIHARLQLVHPLAEKIEHLKKYINCS